MRCWCRPRARASLRNRHQGPSSMGFEDEAEQSLGRPCRLTDSRSKRTYELTSSIVPRGTSFHRWVELECSPIVIDPARLSCRCGFPGPAELGAVNPYAVHDHGQSGRQCHDRFLHSTTLATCMAQALSHEHFFECRMLWPLRRASPASSRRRSVISAAPIDLAQRHSFRHSILVAFGG